MKRLPLYLCFAIFLAFAFTTIAPAPHQEPVKKNLAEVNRYENYYIFQQCKPVREYEVIGTVKKTGIVWSGNPDEMFKTIMKRVKKDYPNCEGVIFEDVSMEHASCIKFKE